MDKILIQAYDAKGFNDATKAFETLPFEIKKYIVSAEYKDLLESVEYTIDCGMREHIEIYLPKDTYRIQPTGLKDFFVSSKTSFFKIINVGKTPIFHIMW